MVVDETDFSGFIPQLYKDTDLDLNTAHLNLHILLLRGFILHVATPTGLNIMTRTERFQIRVNAFNFKLVPFSPRQTS